MIKTDIKGLYKDERTGAIINKDNSALAAYKKKKQHNAEFKELKSRVSFLEERVTALEAMLRGNH